MCKLLFLLSALQAISPILGVPLLYQFSVRNGQNVVTEVKTRNPKKYYININDSDSVIASALYEPVYKSTGWDFFQVTTNKAFSDDDQAFAAGYLEGQVTHDMIYMHWYNNLGTFCSEKNDICREVEDFIRANMAWIRKNVAEHSSVSDYWHQVKLYYKQIDGMVEGYNRVNKNKSRELSEWDIMLMNNPDLDDIMTMLRAKKSNFTQMNLEESAKVLGLLPCSALIKVLPDRSDIFAAQVTWSAYRTMLRIQKKYDFAYHLIGNRSAIVPGRSMTFSSYPGVITSGDDFYVISSGLVTMETTIGNSNASLWKEIKPIGQVSEGVRSMVANRLSRNGRTWSKIFSGYNSGTYNNQWMILDYKKFKGGADLPNDLLWISEQIPGYIRSEDMSSTLRKQGYWPSYNTAFFKDVFDKSGNGEMVKKYGDWFTYDKNPRALIFQRDHGTVNDLQSMLLLMQYNDFKNDPLSTCNCTPPYSAENAISARNDLNPKNGTYPFPALGHRDHGATDAKITSKALFSKGLKFLSVSGPIYNETRGIPPFQWSASDFDKSTRHEGQPDLWKFKPLIYNWN